MNKEKVVVVLLLITIILSIVSVVITLAVEPASADSGVEGNTEDSGSGSLGFEILPNPNNSGGTG